MRGKPKFEADPNVQFPKRRETDVQAAQRAEMIDLREMERENSGPTFNRAMARKMGFRAKLYGQSRQMDVPRQ